MACSHAAMALPPPPSYLILLRVSTARPLAFLSLPPLLPSSISCPPPFVPPCRPGPASALLADSDQNGPPRLANLLVAGRRFGPLASLCPGSGLIAVLVSTACQATQLCCAELLRKRERKRGPEGTGRRVVNFITGLRVVLDTLSNKK